MKVLTFRAAMNKWWSLASHSPHKGGPLLSSVTSLMQLRTPLLVCREFVVNIVSHWMLEAANVTCGDFEHNESEWEAANLTPMPSLKVIGRWQI